MVGAMASPRSARHKLASDAIGSSLNVTGRKGSRRQPEARGFLLTQRLGARPLDSPRIFALASRAASASASRSICP